MNDTTDLTSDLRHVPVILRFRDGSTQRFLASPEINVENQTVRVRQDDDSLTEIPFADLKAIFYLRGEGVPEEMPGSNLAVEFADGEIIRGTTTEYNPARNGFFLHPQDQSRVEKIFIVNSAIVSIDVEKL